MMYLLGMKKWMHTFLSGNTKKHAKEAAARNATGEMFGLDYSKSPVFIPVPKVPCVPVGVSVPYMDDEDV
jgi:PAB1-binding protein PBP1